MKAIRGTPMARMLSMIMFSSAVSPLWEMASRTSSFVTIPRSPWRPSTGWRKRACVPVLVSVATIFLPIRPDLPIPATITRPLQR